ncbi:hypothetical protein R1flu_018368 [Riccia fluitans]|uniref:Ribosomal RNA methyltransferase FtsJ domain-containing protein n=1 Tax=Riccia fluitans TaxID=41844 RepID=A0ABD1ZGY4_9MARC
MTVRAGVGLSQAGDILTGKLRWSVFRSQDYTALLYAFKQLFVKVEVTKPVASRATSAEIYVVGLKSKAPAKIDPRLLDHRHLFKEVEEPAKGSKFLGCTYRGCKG